MLDRQVISNPFDSDVVEDPGVAAPIDVPRIHEAAFDLCRHAYERVASGMGSWSVRPRTWLTGFAALAIVSGA
jgi:hypothetical protein